MKSEMSVVIKRPIKEVFDFTTNKVAEWSIIVVEDEVINETEDGVGSTFRVVTEERGKRMTFEGVVTLHEPPTRSSCLMTGKYFDIEADYRFEDLDGETRVSHESNVRGKGMVRVMFALFGWLMKKGNCDAMEKEMQNLKRVMEA